MYKVVLVRPYPLSSSKNLILARAWIYKLKEGLETAKNHPTARLRRIEGMESDPSDLKSEGSESSERADDFDINEKAYGDDEDYVDEVEEVKSRKPQRSTPARGGLKRSKRAIVDDEDGDFDEVVPTRKRTKTTKTVHDEEDEDLIDEEKVEPGFEDVGFESQEDSEKVEPMEEEEDDNMSDDASSRLASRMPDEEDEEEAREDTQGSFKTPSNSKMLRSLLGNSKGRKGLTEEEVQLKRAENARKRKNLSEKRIEEEKQETINKLLRRRAGKSRSHLPKEDEPQEGSQDATAFAKPRRPYDSTGMTRILRNRSQDLYCTVSPDHL